MAIRTTIHRITIIFNFFCCHPEKIISYLKILTFVICEIVLIKRSASSYLSLELNVFEHIIFRKKIKKGQIYELIFNSYRSMEHITTCIIKQLSFDLASQCKFCFFLFRIVPFQFLSNTFYYKKGIELFLD